jgi:flagellar hook-basal body complex protein FliE
VIAPISSLPGLPPSTAPAPAGAGAGAGATGAAFASTIGNAVDSLQSVQNAASAAEAATAAGQGSLTNTMIAASEASLETQVTTSVIDKALAAYNSVIQMTF